MQYWQTAEKEYEDKIYNDVETEDEYEQLLREKAAEELIDTAQEETKAPKKPYRTPASKSTPPTMLVLKPGTWIKSLSVEERAAMCSKEGVVQTNPCSNNMWQSGNSLADNMRIVNK